MERGAEMGETLMAKSGLGEEGEGRIARGRVGKEGRGREVGKKAGWSVLF